MLRTKYNGFGGGEYSLYSLKSLVSGETDHIVAAKLNPATATQPGRINVWYIKGFTSCGCLWSRHDHLNQECFEMFVSLDHHHDSRLKELLVDRAYVHSSNGGQEWLLKDIFVQEGENAGVYIKICHKAEAEGLDDVEKTYPLDRFLDNWVPKELA